MPGFPKRVPVREPFSIPHGKRVIPLLHAHAGADRPRAAESVKRSAGAKSRLSGYLGVNHVRASKRRV